jgi:inhibitor of cysteine peptidase
MSSTRFHPFRKGAVSFIFVLLFALSACSPPAIFAAPVDPAPLEEPTPAYLEDVLVESLEVFFLKSFPVQVHVIVRGQLPDACSFIEMVEQAYGNNHFEVTLTNARQPNMRCAPQPTPFEENIPLDVYGLDAGNYTVTVHGIETSFELPVDNIIIEE